MDTRNFAATQKSGAGHDKGATNINAPSTGAQGQQREGGNHPVFTPSYHTAMTTDGFKNDNVSDDATQHGGNITTPTPVADGSQPLGQQQQKGAKIADWTQGDEAQKQQQGSKLRGVFGRLKKGGDAVGDETTEGQGEVGGDAKQKGDGGVVE